MKYAKFLILVVAVGAAAGTTDRAVAVVDLAEEHPANRDRQRLRQHRFL